MLYTRKKQIEQTSFDNTSVPEERGMLSTMKRSKSELSMHFKNTANMLDNHNIKTIGQAEFTSSAALNPAWKTNAIMGSIQNGQYHCTCCSLETPKLELQPQRKSERYTPGQYHCTLIVAEAKINPIYSWCI